MQSNQFFRLMVLEKLRAHLLNFVHAILRTECPYRILGPPSLLSSGYRGLFSWVQSGRGVKLTTHVHLVPRLRIRGARPPLPLRLHVVVLS